MATVEASSTTRRRLMTEASAAYQRRIDKLRREEDHIRSEIATLRDRMQDAILERARGGETLVVPGYDVVELPAHEKLDPETLPKPCRELMTQIEDAIDRLHGVMAERARKEECRWSKLAQYLSAPELVELIAGAAGATPTGGPSPMVSEFERESDYRGPFHELIVRKPWIQVQNGGRYYDIYVRTSTPEDRVYVGGDPPPPPNKPPRDR